MSDGLLFTITSAVDFIFLTTLVWLGLYIVTRSPRNQVSWLASGTLWSLAGSFLNSLVYIHAPPESEGLPWWWGWSVTIAVALWFHLSVSLLPPALNRKRRWFVILIYFVSLNFIAMETYTTFVYKEPFYKSLLTYNALQPGPLYPFFGLFLILILTISLYNLWIVRRMSRVLLLQKQFIILNSAVGFAILGVIYWILSTGFGLTSPIWLGDLCLGVGAVLLGYGTVRINALNEGRVVGRDFLFSFVATSLVIGAYLFASFFSRMTLGVPFVAFIFIILLAITSHSLIDWGRERLENFFYRSQTHPELRHELREFSRTTTSDHDVQERLSTLLRTFCRTLKVNSGFIALRDKDEFYLAVDWKGEELADYLDVIDLSTDEIHISEPQLDVPDRIQTLLVAPLIAGGAQVGAIVLGVQTPSRIFNEDDFVIVEDFSDTVAGVIHNIHLQEENLQIIQSLVEEMQEREKELQTSMMEVLAADDLHPFLNLKDEDEAISLIEDSLRHLYDFSFLGTHPLASLSIVNKYLQVESGGSVTHIDRGKAVQELLVAAIGKLRPFSPKPSPPPKEWHQYVIMKDCYVEGKLNREVMGALFIGEGTFNRARRRAVRAITRVIAEMERSVLEY